MKTKDIHKLQTLICPYADYLCESITAYGTGEHSDLEWTFSTRSLDYAVRQNIRAKDGSSYLLRLDDKLIYQLDIDWTIPNIADILDKISQVIIKRKKATAQIDADYHKIKCIIND